MVCLTVWRRGTSSLCSCRCRTRCRLCIACLRRQWSRLSAAHHRRQWRRPWRTFLAASWRAEDWHSRNIAHWRSSPTAAVTWVVIQSDLTTWHLILLSGYRRRELMEHTVTVFGEKELDEFYCHIPPSHARTLARKHTDTSISSNLYRAYPLLPHAKVRRERPRCQGCQGLHGQWWQKVEGWRGGKGR